MAKSSARSLNSSNEVRAIDVENLEKDLEEEYALDLNALKQEIFLKILVLGDLGVGKTSLIRKYTGDGKTTF